MQTDRIVQAVMEVMLEMGISLENKVPVGISARHVHLCREDVDRLFGKGHELTPIKDLSQPGQFACAETVSVKGPRGKIERVRILGPERAETQVEVSASDARRLGIDPPVRSSGDIKDTPGAVLETESGSVSLLKGVIIAERHLHMTAEEAARYGFRDGQEIQAVVPGKKGGIMRNIYVRAGDAYALDLHIDTDDASAFLLKQGQKIVVAPLDWGNE